jgi:hypothetical protein
MYPTSTVVTSITSDRIGAAETARRANRSHHAEEAAPRHSRRPPNRALRIAFLGLR